MILYINVTRCFKVLLPISLIALILAMSSELVAGASKTLSHDLIEIRSVEPSIVVDLPYATSKNFTNKKLYPDDLCFLHINTAKALAAVQNELKAYGFGLKIKDGYRPLSIHNELSQVETDIHYFPSDQQPKEPLRHARGTAVNVILVDKNKLEMAMPIQFDIFNEKTLRDCESLNEDALFNRIFLELAMERHGFVAHPYIWWHFDLESYENYPLLDDTLEDLVAEYYLQQKSNN